jgi:hypothetical protein
VVFQLHATNSLLAQAEQYGGLANAGRLSSRLCPMRALLSCRCVYAIWGLSSTGKGRPSAATCTHSLLTNGLR